MSKHLCTLHKAVQIWVEGDGQRDVERALETAVTSGDVDGWPDGKWQVTRVGLSSVDEVEARCRVVDGVVVRDA